MRTAYRNPRAHRNYGEGTAQAVLLPAVVQVRERGLRDDPDHAITVHRFQGRRGSFGGRRSVLDPHVWQIGFFPAEIIISEPQTIIQNPSVTMLKSKCKTCDGDCFTAMTIFSQVGQYRWTNFISLPPSE
jgi:hypothetical protein